MSQTPGLSLPSALRTNLRHAPTIVGLLASAVLGILYFQTRAVVHTFDAVSYMWNVEVKPLQELFHPHHLLYAPLGQLVYHLAQSFGYSGHSDVPIQAVNALAGALGILFLWRFGARWTGRVWAALGVALAVGLCYAYWLYASEVEVYTLAAAFLMLSLWVLVALDEKPHPARAAALGLAHAGAVMFHQTNVLFAVPVMLFLLTRPNLRRPAILLGYAVPGALAMLIPYGLVILSSGLRDGSAITNWLTDYAQTGRWGHYLSLDHLPALRAGLGNSVSGRPWLVGGFYGLALLGMGLGVWQARRDPRRAAWLAFGGAWLVLYGLFFWWWEPFNIEFWIALLPLWGFWMMAGWPVPMLETPPEVNPPGRALSLSATLYALVPFVLAILLYRTNLAPVRSAGDPNNDYYYLITAALQAQMASDDLVVTRGNILDVYIPFYARHSGYLSLREVEYDDGGDRTRIMADLTARLDQALATGQTIWVDQMVLDEARSADRNPFGLLPEEIGALKARYSFQPGVAWNGANVFYSTPRAGRPDATAWTFTDSLLGWRAWGVDAPRFEQGAWCFTGGADPQLQSPLLEVDAGQRAALEIDLTLYADGSILQVFWRGTDGDYSLEHSAQIATQRGRRVYTVPLAGAPGWQGAIIQLRIDPVPGGDPIPVCLYSVELSAVP